MALFLLIFLLLLSSTYSAPVYTPTTATSEDTTPKYVSYGYDPAQSIHTFSGLNTVLSPCAVVTLQIWLAHSYNSDCIIRLYAPDNTYVTLSNRRGGSKANVFDGTLFTDAAQTIVANYAFLSDGAVTPLRSENQFATLRGKNPNGQWKVWVSDVDLGSNGYLNKVILKIEGK